MRLSCFVTLVAVQTVQSVQTTIFRGWIIISIVSIRMVMVKKKLCVLLNRHASPTFQSFHPRKSDLLSPNVG